MIAVNEIRNLTCQQLLAAFFTKYPDARLKIEADRILKRLMAQKVPMLGRPGGWAGGIIYALTNQYRRACGIPGFLNKECEEFFNVSMETIYRRAAMVKKLSVI
ncbi:MAG TPA: hypothetical protein DIU00_14455 [Phycisphaerales bacterium]|nr:hypothetical protein [Phycisphaerales bacterium]